MVYVILIIVGLSLGSFINALVWRIHEQYLLKRTGSKTTAEFSVLTGHSMCPNCKHALAPLDLLPVLSWALLKGRCRYCKKPISVQYPLVELISVLLFIASYIWWPFMLSGTQVIIFALWLLILTGMIALAVYDIKWMLLPNRVLYPVAYLTLIMAVVTILSSQTVVRSVLDAIVAIFIGGGIFYVIYQVSRGKWIGGGDVRLGAVLGLVVGTPGKSLLLLFLAALIGTIVSLPLLFTKTLKKNSVIPFGPFLILAAFIVVLFGSVIINWYQNIFLV